jgi:hypothetical protein
MLIGYFDDSGTHTSSEIVVMAGFVGAQEQWEQFEKTWADKLLEPLKGKPPLRRFHMVDCMQRSREFSDYSEAERNAVIHDFRQIILDANLIGNVTAVDRVAWDEVMIGPLRMLHGDAERHCINSCMSFSINQPTKVFGDNDVELDGAELAVFSALVDKSDACAWGSARGGHLPLAAGFSTVRYPIPQRTFKYVATVQSVMDEICQQP